MIHAYSICYMLYGSDGDDNGGGNNCTLYEKYITPALLLSLCSVRFLPFLFILSTRNTGLLERNIFF